MNIAPMQLARAAPQVVIERELEGCRLAARAEPARASLSFSAVNFPLMRAILRRFDRYPRTQPHRRVQAPIA